MQVHRNYKFRLYPNKSQQNLLVIHFFASNQEWNAYLSIKKTDNADANAAKNIRDYEQWSLEQMTRWTQMSVKSSQVSMESMESVLLGDAKHQLEASLFRSR